MNVISKLKVNINLCWFLSISLFLISFKADQGRISVHLESQRLHQGKVVTTIADMYFKYNDGSLVIHYIKPNDYVFITNAKGEAKAYYPAKNEVVIHQNEMFSSENDILYTFLSNRHSDMGLKEGGFTLINSKIDKTYVITTWIPQATNNNTISKIELVHENYFPIYMAFYGVNGKAYRKSYFSSYITNHSSPFPSQIIDIDYLPKNDSIVSRKKYSDVKMNEEATSSYFEFTVPANSKLVKVQMPTEKKK